MLAGPIITSRLRLRRFEEKDREDLFAFLYQLKGDEFEGYPDISRENVDEQLRYRMESGQFLAMEHRDSGKVIGNVFIGNIDEKTKEIGYIVKEEYRRRGFAFEAVSIVMKIVLSEGVERLLACTDEGNERSWRLLEKAGFSLSRRLQKETISRDGVIKEKTILVYVYPPETNSTGKV